MAIFTFNLPTLAEVEAARRSKSFWKGAPRVEEKAAKDKGDSASLEQWKRAVYHRDRNRCRKCGIRVIASIELVPNRREAHHIVSRRNKLLRTDQRNGLTVCATHHERLTRHKLFVVQKAADMFTADDGHSYIDGDKPVEFRESK